MDQNQLKPFHLIIMFVFGAAALIGLFVFANFSGGGAASGKAGPVVVWGTLPKEPFETAIAELGGVDDRYTEITYVEVPSDSFSAELANAIASGQGPDLIVISNELLYAERAKLEQISFDSLPKRTYTDTYVPLFDLFLTETGTYGLPLAVDPLVLYYNKAILASEQAIAPPATWESVSGFAAAVTDRSPEGYIGRSAIALGEFQNVRNARAILSLLLLQAGTPITASTANGTEAVFAQSDSYTFGATPAQSAVNYYAQFADPAKSVYSWNRSLPESRAAFLSGDLALYLGFASEHAFISAANPNLDFDMALVPRPGSQVNRIGYGVGYVFAVPRGAANQSGALLAAFALGGEAYASSIASGLGMAPAHRNALRAPSDDSFRTLYYPEALVAKGWISPSPSQTDAIFSAMIGDIAAGRTDIDKALSAAAASIDAALR